MSGASGLKVMIVSPEVSPYAKSGGLGDVAGSLPKALSMRGVDARVVFPKYRNIDPYHLTDMKYVDSFVVPLGWRRQSASIHSIKAPVPTYVIENDFYFGRDGFYGYGDDFERFGFFSKAVVEFLAHIDFKPDIIHLNDWQTGLVSVYLKDFFNKLYFFQGIKCLYTIHNLQYQGIFGREVLGAIDLPDWYFTSDKMEFYGTVNYMKTGIVYADAISTVSPSYAEDIKSPSFGYGLDGVIRSRSDRLFGILNGIDTAENDPATDDRIYEKYSCDTLETKKINKQRLQADLGLHRSDAPIIGIVSRLADHKGMDLVAFCMEELMSRDIQMVILGTGEGRYENLLKHYAWRFQGKLSVNIFFGEALAQKIYAGADMFLMPSLSEPCGLGQLIAMRYGTVPIVRKTGGLNDTVSNYDSYNKTGNGFVFQDYVASGMMWAVNQALGVYYNKDEWERVVKNAMQSDYSWDQSAISYIDLYEKLLKM